MDLAAVLVIIDEIGITFTAARELDGIRTSALEIGGEIFVAYLAVS